MITKLAAHCGCKQSLHTDNVITAHEVIRWAQDHAFHLNHTVIIAGEVRMPKKPHAVRGGLPFQKGKVTPP